MFLFLYYALCDSPKSPICLDSPPRRRHLEGHRHERRLSSRITAAFNHSTAFFDDFAMREHPRWRENLMFVNLRLGQHLPMMLGILPVNSASDAGNSEGRQMGHICFMGRIVYLPGHQGIQQGMRTRKCHNSSRCQSGEGRQSGRYGAMALGPQPRLYPRSRSCCFDSAQG